MVSDGGAILIGYVEGEKSLVQEVYQILTRLKDIDQLISLVSVNLSLEVQDQQNILETEDPQQRYVETGSNLLLPND